MPYRNECKNPACLNRINDLEKEITTLMQKNIKLAEKLNEQSFWSKFLNILKKTPKLLPPPKPIHPDEGKWWSKGIYAFTVYNGVKYATDDPAGISRWIRVSDGKSVNHDLIECLKAQAALEKLEVAMKEFLVIHAAPRTRGVFSYVRKTDKRETHIITP